MPDPRPVLIELNNETRAALEKVERQYSTSQQLAQRVRIILLAGAGKNHSQISQELGISLDMARQWPGAHWARWSSFAPIPLSDLSVSERLEDAPRPGKPSAISAEQLCKIVALACEAPEKSGRPISQWTGREIADEIMRQNIVEAISPRHAQRILKKRSKALPDPLLADTA